MSDTAASLLKLPVEILDMIYAEVLHVNHQMYIYQSMPWQLGLFAPGKPRHWLALCHTNRQIREGASRVLFRVNAFNFDSEGETLAHELTQFLRLIGPSNALNLPRLHITFPIIERRSEEDFVLSQATLETVRLLREQCRSLVYLECHLRWQQEGFLVGLEREGSRTLRKALSQLDLALRTIPSLKTFVVGFTCNNPSSLMKDAMRRVGWKVRPRSRGLLMRVTSTGCTTLIQNEADII